MYTIRLFSDDKRKNLVGAIHPHTVASVTPVRAASKEKTGFGKADIKHHAITKLTRTTGEPAILARGSMEDVLMCVNAALHTSEAPLANVINRGLILEGYENDGVQQQSA